MAEVHAEATEYEMKNKCLAAALEPATNRFGDLRGQVWKRITGCHVPFRAACDEAEKKQQLQKDLDERSWSQSIDAIICYCAYL